MEKKSITFWWTLYFAMLLTPCPSASFSDFTQLVDVLKSPVKMAKLDVVSYSVEQKNLLKLCQKFFKDNLGSIRLQSLSTSGQMSSLLVSDINDRSHLVALVQTNDELDHLIDLVAMERLGTSKPVFIVMLNSNPNLGPSKGSRIQIDQAIYFLDISLLKMYSMYSVNNVTVRKEVGFYKVEQSVLVFLKNFNWKSMEPEQRSDYYGKHLVGMTLPENPYTLFPPNFKETSKYFHGT